MKVVTEAKNLLEDIIKKHTSITKIVRRKIEEKNTLSTRKFPFAVLLTADGNFNESTCKEVFFNEYNYSIPKETFENEIIGKLTLQSDIDLILSAFELNGELYNLKTEITDLNPVIEVFKKARYLKTRYKYFVRGSRNIPIECRVYTQTEDEADDLIGEIIRFMPRAWSIGKWQGKINIQDEAHDDYASNYAGQAMSLFVAFFEIETGTDTEVVQSITQTNFEGGSYG